MRNCIIYLLDASGYRVFNQSQIKEMVVAYFHNLLGYVEGLILDTSVDELRGLLSYRLAQEVADKLIIISSEEDIKTTLFAMPKNKAPGPDGYSAEFFWEAWEIVGKDLIGAVK